MTYRRQSKISAFKRSQTKEIVGNCLIFPIHITNMRVTSLDSSSHFLRSTFIDSQIFLPAVTLSQCTHSFVNNFSIDFDGPVVEYLPVALASQIRFRWQHIFLGVLNQRLVGGDGGVGKLRRMGGDWLQRIYFAC